MKQKKNLFMLLILLVVVIAAAAIAYNVLAPTVETQTLMQQGETASTNNGGEQNTGSNGSAYDEVMTTASDFTMTSLDGQKIRLKSLEGKPLVLNFWASTCGPCKREMPAFQSAYEEYGDRVQFVMVNIPGFNGETHERALRLIDQQGYTFPVFFDDNAEAKNAYSITSIPRTYFINSDGTIETYAMGSLSNSDLVRGIKMII